ncbi:uncharacterized protein LOC127751134 [Frankliniella occidentalis]|uniref:Uncharacterized protein LOC127751134 n=1 Tax=Frankliniella occidentalis TaxID=133901 RepID=A0A9C6XT88_FRAOC|nr:uncharacterized protein LOC127751134 [Frankliniella occidentalis]
MVSPILLGDSILKRHYAQNNSLLDPLSKTFCVSGQTVAELSSLVRENFQLLKDRKVTVMIGTNVDVRGRVLADLDKCGGGGAGLRWLLSPEPERDDVAPPSADASIFPLVDHILKSSDYQSAESKRAYLEEALRMDSQLIEFLAEATISQSSNPLWAAVRKCRLTATKFGSILRPLKNNRKVPPSTLKALLHPACLDKVLSAIWGRDHEGTAIAAFTEKTGKTVSPTGM